MAASVAIGWSRFHRFATDSPASGTGGVVVVVCVWEEEEGEEGDGEGGGRREEGPSQ